MFNLGIVLLLVAAVLWLLMGVKYLSREMFMPYHAAVVGRSRSDLEGGTQAVMPGMLRVIGGGFASLVWRCYGSVLRCIRAPTGPLRAILSISTTALSPLLYVTLTLRSIQPAAAKTPVRECVGGLVLTVAGV